MNKVLLTGLLVLFPIMGFCETIQFKDAEVKKLCVANWDQDGDGELSIDEAASVTSLGDVFTRNETIRTFEELSFFSGLTSISPDAFLGSSIVNIKLPENITAIEDCAFCGSSLFSITIPQNVTSLGRDAFSDCNLFTSIVLNTAVPPSLDEDALGGNEQLKIFVPAGSKSAYENATGWEDFANILEKTDDSSEIILFADAATKNLCVSLWDMNGDGELSVNEAAAVTSLGEEFGRYFQEVGAKTFDEFRYFTGMTVLDSDAFNECSDLVSIILPTSLETIGSGAFWDCKNLTSIQFPDNLKSIDDYAFHGCEGLTSVIIPQNVEWLCGTSFYGCKNVTKVVVDENNSEYDSREDCNAIISTSFNEIIWGCINTVIPSSVTSIGQEAFGNLTSLKDLVIPSNIVEIEESAFWGCSGLESIVVEADNPVYDSRDNCNAIIKKEGNELITGCRNTVIPASVTTIGHGAFYGCESLQTITIPSSVTVIKSQAFSRCTGLASLTIPESVTTIEGYVFQDCSSLTSVVLPETITEIGDQMFFECTSLETVNIPQNVTSIGGSAFSGCKKLKSIVIPEKVKEIKRTTFENCESLTSVALPQGLLSIGSIAFRGCKSLTSINLPETLTSIGDYAFGSCSSLTSIVIPEGVAVIEWATFVGCTSLVSVVFPESLVNIEREAFLTCAKLESITIPKAVTNIGNSAFGNCNSLVKVICHITKPLEIEKYTFENRKNAILYVPQGCKADYQSAVYWKEFKNIVEIGETTDITIGKSGKASYCGDKSLDFSFSDEVKAYIATGFDETEGTIWLTRVKDVPAGTPVLIKGKAEKTYNVPVTDSQNSYYKNMFKGNTSGDKIQIPETEGDLVNYYLSGDGTFKKVKNYANIGNNKSYLQLPGTFAAPAAGDIQTVTIKSSGKASYAAPVDLDFTNVEGLKAFTATGLDKSNSTIWLTRVMKVQKGEGLLLKGEAKDYQIPSVAVQSSYGNMFVGNTSGASVQVQETSDDGSLTNYYLKGDGTFVSVNGYVNIANNKCYLALPTEMAAAAASTRGEANYILDEPEVIKLPILFRSLDNEGNGTTGINVQSSMFNGQSDNAYYTLQGQRVVNPGKGIYIKNGRKVVIR